MRVTFAGTIFAMLCVLGTSMVIAEDQGESAGKPLKQLYEEAKRLSEAETPEQRQQAIAKYKAVIKAHLANDETFAAAMRELAKSYEDSGQTEEGIRFFIGLTKEMQSAERWNAFKEIYTQYLLKHREQVQKIASEMNSSSGTTGRIRTTVPAKDLAQAILQRDDKELRDKSLEQLRQMLSADSSHEEQRSALNTLRLAMSAKFDRDSFLPLVLPLLESEDGQIRAMALVCVPGVGATAGDLPRVIPLAEDAAPMVRMYVASTLIALGKGKNHEQVIPALMRLLQDKDSKVVEQSIRSMWGQYSSPEFDQLLIALSREPRYHHNVIYFGLSTMRTKSTATCRRLVEELADPDWNNSGRAAWGLTYGVQDEAKGLVEEGLLKALPEETNSYTRKQEFRALRQVATEKSRDYLKSVADSELEAEEFKELGSRDPIRTGSAVTKSPRARFRQGLSVLRSR